VLFQTHNCYGPSPGLAEGELENKLRRAIQLVQARYLKLTITALEAVIQQARVCEP